VGFETVAELKMRPLAEVRLASSGRKSSSKKDFRRADGGEVSCFTVSAKCGARGRRSVSSRLSRCEIMFSVENLKQTSPVGECRCSKCQFVFQEST
jgi:hypothetical protein